MAEPSRDAPQMRAVGRIAAILGVFSAQAPLRPLSDIARDSGLDKNTARRMLLALAEAGLVVRQGDAYGLGPAVLRMQPAVQAPRALRETAAPWLHELTRETGMTSFAWMPDSAGAVCVERCSTHRTVFAALTWSSAGTTLPLNVAAGPRALLAFLPAEARAAWLARPQPAFTPASLTDPEALMREAAAIRAAGHAYVADDFVVGLAGLGVPVFDRQGHLAGSVSVTAATHVLEERRGAVLAALKRAAAEIGVGLV